MILFYDAFKFPEHFPTQPFSPPKKLERGCHYYPHFIAEKKLKFRESQSPLRLYFSQFHCLFSATFCDLVPVSLSRVSGTRCTESIW